MNNLSGKGLEVFGIKELEHMFKDLPKKMSNSRKWNTLWREIGKPLVKEAKLNADAISQDSPVGTGRLGKSIKYFTTRRSRKFLGGMIGPRVKGAFSSIEKSGFYGAWVEYGSQTNFGGKGFGQNQPFMEPAFNATREEMNRNARQSTLNTVEKLMKSYLKRTEKYGILGR